MKLTQGRPHVADEKNIGTETPRVEDALVRLLAGSLAFSVAIMAMLLGILLDLSGNTYERIRLAVELLAVLGVGSFAMWFGVIRRGRI